MTPRNSSAEFPVEIIRPGPPTLVTIGHIRLLDAGPRAIKRLFDLLCAVFLGLAALLPSLLIALAIILDSPGPVFFRHARVGRGRKPFRIWKFRTMVEDAGPRLSEYLATHPERANEWARTHKLKEDPRTTRVGRFLRKTSLDELPQLWNVLCGDMSLIGPRPIVAQEVSKYGVKYALYAQVLPGITGLWQVSGRNDTHYARRVDLDCQYIRNWSLAWDLKILFKTIFVVARGHGAY
jgi:Undecaprenyl-phosphate galactose phosphotransferase WbaP